MPNSTQGLSEGGRARGRAGGGTVGKGGGGRGESTRQGLAGGRGGGELTGGAGDGVVGRWGGGRKGGGGSRGAGVEVKGHKGWRGKEESLRIKASCMWFSDARNQVTLHLIRHRLHIFNTAKAIYI